MKIHVQANHGRFILSGCSYSKERTVEQSSTSRNVLILCAKKQTQRNKCHGIDIKLQIRCYRKYCPKIFHFLRKMNATKFALSMELHAERLFFSLNDLMITSLLLTLKSIYIPPNFCLLGKSVKPAWFLIPSHSVLSFVPCTISKISCRTSFFIGFRSILLTIHSVFSSTPKLFFIFLYRIH